MEQTAEREPSAANTLANYLAVLFGCSRVIDAGSEHERLEPETLRGTIVCGEFPAFDSPETRAQFLDRLRTWMTDAPAAVIASSDDASNLRRLLEKAGLRVDFAGGASDTSTGGRVQIAILAGEREAVPARAPHDFRVVAIMAAYNEADVIGAVLEELISQGLEVHLLDNWSTDGTERIASRYLGRGLRKIERFPSSGPQPHYELGQTLRRIEQLSESIDADWIVVNDADEVRRSPWSGLTLRDAIFTADQRGFNAIDYTDLEFEPTDDSFPDGGSLDHFRYFRFGTNPWHFLKINSFKRTGHPVNLVDSGGHEVHFEGRRVFPYKFLLKHYPVRTQQQGERKIFQERKQRWAQEERALGWHVHYDQVQPGDCLIKNPANLIRFDERRFPEEFLIERLSGIGIALGPDSVSRTIEDEESPHSMEASKREEQAQQAIRLSAALGEAQAELADLKLRVRESEEREQRLIERVFEAEDGVAEALATEHELRVQIGRYAQFYQALQKSRPWKTIQSLRRLVGREW